MSKTIGNEQLGRLARHYTGIGEVLLETLLSPDHICPKEAITSDEPGTNGVPWPEPVPFKRSFPPILWQDEAVSRRERDLGRLCGRWTVAPHRCGIEIVRAGEHFVLRYLKRSGRPTGERYVLIWLDGDILYYGRNDRITLLALDSETDTLMVSPGEDYTRQAENEK
ncbi:hypothetical protein [Alistipes indistinctus]|uniref:hypothetical protein n=1 Tax=Alistipes indistinctus TaxID=626932 RepID=UPI0015F2477D|nr:hypothetical protein [Alistipes indistinctus]BCG54311.1 hypothetical protein AI2BBH_13570 [Alistipes indistinctus]